MLTPEAAMVELELIDAVRKARGHLTRDAVLWRVIAFSEDPDAIGYHPSRGGRTLADYVMRWLDSHVKESKPKVDPDADLCECDRPDESDNPHRHKLDEACVYWIAGRPGSDAIKAAIEGRLPLTAPAQRPARRRPLPDLRANLVSRLASSKKTAPGWFHRLSGMTFWQLVLIALVLAVVVLVVFIIPAWLEAGLI